MDTMRWMSASRSVRRWVGLMPVAVGAIPLLAMPISAQNSVSPSASLVLEGVTVVDVEQGRLLPNQRVTIVGNHIQALGAVKGALPAGAQVVKGKGKYLIPGLWDMRTQLEEDRGFSTDLAASLFVINGVLGIRNAWERATEGKNTQYGKRRDSVLAGTSVGPPRQLLTDFVWPDSAEAAPNIRTAAKQLRKTTSSFALDIVNYAVLDLVRASGLPAGGGLRDYGKTYGLPLFNISAAMASDSGLRLIEHVYMAGGLDTLCWGPSGSVAGCRSLTARLVHNDTWFAPTIIGAFLEMRPPAIGAPHARAVYDRWRQRLTAFGAGAPLKGNWLQDSTGASAVGGGGAMSVIEQIAEFPLLAGTGGVSGGPGVAPSSPSAPGFALHAELAMYVAEGLTPLRALQAATLNPAKFLHATDSLGTVAAGKLADMVLLDANPLEDITNTTAIRAVVANGRYYDRAALDKLWENAKALAQQNKLGKKFP